MAKKTNNIGAKIGAGALAAAALAMAGGYVLWERMDKKQKENAKAWVRKARKEAAEKFAMAKKMSEGEYERIVDMAVERYGTLAKVNKPELQKTASMLKSEWKRIQGHAKLMAKEMQKSADSVKSSKKSS